MPGRPNTPKLEIGIEKSAIILANLPPALDDALCEILLASKSVTVSYRYDKGRRLVIRFPKVAKAIALREKLREMDIGGAVLIKGKIVDFDSNPHGRSVKVELDLEDSEHKNALVEITTFWVHRLERSAILPVEKTR